MQKDFKDRKTIRLKEYDYSEAGDYFITICTQDRRNLFGEIVNDEMILNKVGKIVEEEILKTISIRKEIDIDIFSIMPNHMHLIVSLNDFYHDPVGANGRSPVQCENQNNFVIHNLSKHTFTIMRTNGNKII